MKVAIISNGHGEDAIAVNLVKQLQFLDKTSEVLPCPLVGNGHHYVENGFQPFLKNPQFPSGGFIRSFKILLQDIFSGLITHIFKQVFRLKQLCVDVDFVICCGDIFCLVMARLSHKTVYFLPTAKSETFMAHSLVEKFIVSKFAKFSFPRDELTTLVFKKDNLAATFFGNPMMDNLITTKQVVFPAESEKVVGLLPGSRHEAIKNLLFILDVCLALKSNHSLHFVCALSKNLSITDFEFSEDWELTSHDKDFLLIHKNQTVNVLFTYEFLSIINQSDVIIGLAGTANEQACFLNKPVVCFEGFGPQSSLQRFREQRQLLGPLLHLSEIREISKITQLVESCLNKSNKFSKTLKNQQSAKKIIKFMLDDFQSKDGARGGT